MNFVAFDVLIEILIKVSTSEPNTYMESSDGLGGGGLSLSQHLDLGSSFDRCQYCHVKVDILPQISC